MKKIFIILAILISISLSAVPHNMDDSSTATVVMDGRNVVSGWDFTNWVNYFTPSGVTSDSFTADAQYDGLSKEITEIGKTYKYNIIGTSTSSHLRLTDISASVYTIITTGGAFSKSGTFVATGDDIVIYANSAGTTTITTLELVDITNAITMPSTTGNLILDMPLCAPFVAGWDGSNYLVTKDRSYSQADGAVSGATITAESGYLFDKTNDIITISGLTTAKTFSFWMSPTTTTETIFEEIDDVGVSISGGTISYGSWDNCYVDGVDTDTVTTGWHHIVLTSTTNVDISALRMGLVNATYYGGNLKGLKGWSRVLTTTEITYEYNTSWNR